MIELLTRTPRCGNTLFYPVSLAWLCFHLVSYSTRGVMVSGQVPYQENPLTTSETSRNWSLT